MDKSTSNKKNVVDHSTLDVKGNLHIGDVTYIINEKTVTIPHLLTNNIPSNTERILGRETELATIATHLANNLPTVLVNGIGGIGKTSVAAKYVATFGHTYKHLAWLTVQSSLVEAFTNDIVLLKSLHIEQDVRQLIETQRLTDAFKLVVHQLNALENTLVILDNANDVADLMTHKNLFDTAKCHYLITSRTQPQEWTIVPIDVLSEDEAVALFRKIAPSVSPDPKGENVSDEALKNLLSKLFYHTLLIELVAKAVENAGFPFAELQTMIETKFIHDENLNEDIVPTGKHGDNYETKRAKIEEYIWLIFSNVKDLGDDAKQILRGMALLPLGISQDRDEIKEYLGIFELENIFPTLTKLIEHGWVNKIIRVAMKPIYEIHPLIIDVIVNHLDVNVRFADRLIRGIAEWIHYRDSNPEHDLFSIYKSKHLADRLKDLFFNEDTEGIALLLDRLGYLETSFGFYQKSLKYRKRALEIAETIFDKNHPFVAEFQNNLGLVYLDLGQYNSSIEVLEVALKTMLNNIEEDSVMVNNCKTNLAHAYQSLGRYEEAAKLLESALASDLRNFGENTPYVALRQNGLAIVYRSLERQQEALKLLESAVRSDLKNLGLYHQETAKKMNNLAMLYQDIGQYSDAIVLMEKALKVDLSIFDHNHPETLTKQANLATTYLKVGRVKEAKKLFRAAYQNALENLGEGHPNTVLLKELMKI